MIVVEIETESELEDSEIKGCYELFKFRKLLSREENYEQIILKVEDLLTLRFLYTFKSSVKLSKELFEDKSCFPKCCTLQVARFLISLHFCEIVSLLFLLTFFSEQKLSGI